MYLVITADCNGATIIPSNLPVAPVILQPRHGGIFLDYGQYHSGIICGSGAVYAVLKSSEGISQCHVINPRYYSRQNLIKYNIIDTIVHKELM